MTARVVFTAGFSRRYTGGVREFEVDAKNLRGVIKAMDRLYPGLGEHLKKRPPPRSKKPVLPRISKAGGGLMPGVGLIDALTLQEADDLDYVRCMPRSE